MCYAPPVFCQWAVTDAPHAALTLKNGAELAKQTYKQAQGYLKQLEQIQNEYNMINNQKDQITHQVNQITNQVQNLKRLPGSIQQSVMASGNKITGLFQALNTLNSAAAQANAQFDALYPQLNQIQTAESAAKLRLAWLQSRRSTASLTVQSTSISDDLSERFKNLTTLLSRSWTVQGNLDAQQITHQQQALQAQIALQAQGMAAVNNRLQAQEQAEKIALDQMRIQAYQQAMQPIDVSLVYAPDGKIQDYGLWYPTR